MLKIRALNEPESSDSETEEQPRQSKEAQESQAINLYKEALSHKAQDEDEKALEIFEQVLNLPYLNEEKGDKILSPIQAQIRLGCLKGLSSLNSSGKTKNLTEAIKAYSEIVSVEPSNVNNWYRYGKIALENQQLELSYECFQKAFACSPGHWGSIEKLVTISYVIHDLFSCLYYCALGLNKDPQFSKGLIFRDYIFEKNPWVKDCLKIKKRGYESLFAERSNGIHYDDVTRDLCLNEARQLLHSCRNRKKTKQQQESEEESTVLKCPLTLKSPTFLELCRTVLIFVDLVKDSGTMLRPVDLSDILSDEKTYESNSQPSSVLRSRSSSDDRDSNNFTDRPSACDSDTISQCVTDDNEEKSVENGLQQTEAANIEEERKQKKKGRKDSKWWQMEVSKRRSQRVRGNLIPTLPNKPKVENNFTETLKNVIPPSLLCVSLNSSKEIENQKNFQTSSISSRDKCKYFGTPLEFEDVKDFIKSCTHSDMIAIVSRLVRNISRDCKGCWPRGLSAVFMELYHFYSTTIPPMQCGSELIGDLLDANDCTEMIDNAFVNLARAELILTESNSNDGCLTLSLVDVPKISDIEFNLRKSWLHLKYLMNIFDKSEVDFGYVESILNRMKLVLDERTENYVCHTAASQDSIISSSSVKEKLDLLDKEKNTNKVEDLYQEQNYELLVEILEFSLVTKEDNQDIKHRFYLAESYFQTVNVKCFHQCMKICELGIKSRSEEILKKCLDLLKQIWERFKQDISIAETSILTNILVQILIYDEKRKIENGYLLTEPWCLLHEVLLYLEKKEPAFYIEEDSVPNSILLLQLGHEILSQTNNCCIENGRLLKYTMNQLLILRNVEDDSDYWSCDESKTCFEQSVLCLYCHPNKKYKFKHLKDHGSSGIDLNWKASLLLFEYYKFEELPEFDMNSKRISADVENLFQRIVENIPEDINPIKMFHQMKDYIEGKNESKPEIPYNIPKEVSDLYYMIADYYFKSKDFETAVEFYIKDISVRHYRFDSWAAIALAKSSDIHAKINACVRLSIEEIISRSDAVVRCFKEALNLEEGNNKLRIEFGSFLYSIHSVFSRELKLRHEQLSLELFQSIDKKKSEYLLEAQRWFEPTNSREIQDDDSEQEEKWLNHYMLGKVAEKLHPNDPHIFLTQYELAGKLLHDQGGSYPAKISYYNPPDSALEALELYYRIHASMLSFVERTETYNIEIEKLLLKFVDQAENSPFVKFKQGRGTENSESKKKSKTDDPSLRNDHSQISELLKEMVAKVEELNQEKDSDSSSESVDSGTLTSEDESSLEVYDNNIKTAPMKSFSLSAFKDKMRENELQDAKLAIESTIVVPDKPIVIPSKPLHNNQFYSDFKDVKFGAVISHCLEAMVECIARFPQCFKAYYWLAYSFKHFKKDLCKAKEFLVGTGIKKVPGLFGEKKPNNFFHGVWRNPVDEFDRAGSFPFHMAKSVQLLLDISYELKDHQILADLGIHLTRVPDSQNVYLFTEDREQFSKEALRNCVIAARQSISSEKEKLIERGYLIYDTYIKFQKVNPRENMIGPVLIDLYKNHVHQQHPGYDTSGVITSDAVKFFQHLAWTSKAITQKTDIVNNRQVSTNGSKTDDKSKNVVMQSDPKAKATTSSKPYPQRRISDQGRSKAVEQTSPTLSPPVSRSSGPPPLHPAPIPSPKLPSEQISPKIHLPYPNQFSTLSQTHGLNSASKNSRKSVPSLQNLREFSNARLSHPIPNSTEKQSLHSIQNKPMSDLLANLASAISSNKSVKPNHPGKATTITQYMPHNSPNARSNQKNQALKFANMIKKRVSDKGKTLQGIVHPMSPQKMIQNINQQQQQSSKTKINQKPGMMQRTTNKTNINQVQQQQSGTTKIQKPGNQFTPNKALRQPMMAIRKPTSYLGGIGPEGSSKVNNSNIDSRSYMSSSPFRAHAPQPFRSISPPSILGLPIGSQFNLSPSKSSGNAPPAAHYQGSINRPVMATSSNGPEVVDLTKKSPEKNTIVQALIPPPRLINMKNLPKKRPISNTSFENERSFPLPPKKKHHIMMASSPRSPPSPVSNPSPRNQGTNRET